MIADDAAIGPGVQRPETKDDRCGCVGLVQPVEHPAHCRRADQRHITIENEDIAVEARKCLLCLQHRMPRAKLLGLKRDLNAERRYRRLYLLAAGSCDHNRADGIEFGGASEKVQQHRAPGYGMQNLVQFGFHPCSLPGRQHDNCNLTQGSSPHAPHQPHSPARLSLPPTSPMAKR